MQTQAIEYHHQETLLQGFWAIDSKKQGGGLKPVVLICHDWSGCHEFVREKAKKIAELGYIGFAIDMFGKGQLGSTKEEKSALIQPFMDDRVFLLKRIQAALAVIPSLPHADVTAVAALGFCFGGLCVLDLARSGADLRAVVSFHGLLAAPATGAQTLIKAKVLALHGYADPMVPPAAVNHFAEEMTQAKADWQIHMYGNTLHAFTNPQAHDPQFGTVYEATADKRSWQTMKNFLAEVFI